MSKRVISLLLALIMIVSCVSVMFTVSAEDDDTIAVLSQIYKKFPAGKYWNHMGSDKNNPDGVTNTPCATHSGCSWVEGACSCNSFDKSIQCMGFAHKVAYDITGQSPRNKFTKRYTLDFEQLRVGDVIRFRGDGHSVCVVGVDYENEQIAIAHANWNNMCGIIWDVWDIAEITNKSFTYVLHLEGNERENADLDFFESIEINEEDYKQEIEPEPEPEITDCKEVWKMRDDANVNIRKSYSTSSTVLGIIPAGTEFNVTQKCDDGKYIWGKVDYKGISGWSVLNYSECIDDGTKKTEVSSIKLSKSSVTVYAGSTHKLTATVSPSDAYNKSVKWVSSDTSVATVSSSGKITGKKPGTTTVTCSATDGSGVKKSCKVSIYPAKVTLKQNVSSTTATKIVFSWNKLSGCKSYKVFKYDGTKKEYVLIKTTSSNTYTDTTVKAGKTYAYIVKGVATVNGKEAVGQSVKITCYTDPAQVKGIKQTASTSKSVTISWNKVSNATHYALYKYNSTKKEYESIGQTTKTSFVCPTDAGKREHIIVYALRKNESGSFKGVGTKIIVTSGPAKPTAKATAGTKSIKLTWTKKTTATKYYIYRYDGKKYLIIAKVDSSKTSYTDKKLTKGKTYSYKVRAVNTKYSPAGYSDYSAVVKAKAK